MFQKPTFGANTSSFGSFNTSTNTASPFGFKPTAGTSTFGAAPSFGATATTQQTGGGGLFGASGSSGGLFGGPSTSTTTPAFGGTSGFGLGNTSGGLFGSNTTGSTLFGSGQQQQTGAFGAKPSGFGFASTSTGTGGGLFGSTTTTGGLFGQQNTSIGAGGLFGGTTTGAFGQQQQAGTAHVKYNPVVGTEVMIKSGNSQNINTKHHCITCMKEYESKSLEELRLEDYVAGRKGSTNAGVFGSFQPPAENKPLFGGNTFGQPATTSTGMFGGGLGTGGFGQTNTFSFGGATQNTNTSNLFGASKPAFGATSTAGGGLFGSSTTQAAPAFGTNTSTFNFGANAQNQSTNLFAKPATSGFGSTPTATGGFGSFGSTGNTLFKPASTATPAFGTTTPAFGTLSGGFGTNTSTSGGLFSNTNAFGTKPAPAFGFGTNQQTPGLGGGLGTGLGANTFQTKPGGSVFPSFSTGGGAGGGSIFTGAAQNQAPSLSFGNTLGGGLNTGLGGFGTGTALGGTGLGGFNNASNLQRNNLAGASAGGNVHEQILTLAARPYGDSPLFKDIVPDAAEDALKPTNPAAVKAVLDRSSYKVASPETPRLRVQPHTNKKSLFDGLEESDASLEDKLSLKPSRKRLVLRMNSQQNGMDNSAHLVDLHNNRSSLEDADRPPSERVVENGPQPRPSDSFQENAGESAAPERNERAQSAQRTNDVEENLRGVNTDLEESSERHGSWLGSSRLSWNDNKDKQEAESSSGLYPDIEKELKASRTSNSWLRRKSYELMLSEGGRPSLGSNSDVVESSVRELGIKQKTANENNTTAANSVSEEDNVAPRNAPPHPAGVKLTRPGYYTIPSLDDMINYIKPDGRCVVPSLTVGRKNYGSVHYDCAIDVTGLDLDHLVHFLNKEVIVYPDDANKPPVGQELNRRATVTLDRVWPRDKTEKRPITEPDRLLTIDYEGKLRRVCEKHDTKFIEYRPETGSWVFRVEHFSKYGLTDSDEEDDPVPQVLRRQLVKEPIQQSGAPAPSRISATGPAVPALTSTDTAATSAPMVGLGGLGGALFGAEKDPMFAMEQTSCDLLGGLGSLVLEMDTTEDNGESQVLYPEPVARPFGVKSPTSELARLELRRTHNVQLMKASLYAETDAEDVSVATTGDQLVPQPSSLYSTPAVPTTKSAPSVDDFVVAPVPMSGEEAAPMKPLVVRPHTVVLRYHRKVPPFHQTIAGRLQASCIADMSVSRARHSRAGFGPAGALVHVTTRDSASGLPPVSELSELERYLRGRNCDDWSEQVVSRITISGRGGGGGGGTGTKYKDVLSAHLKALLEHSEHSQSPGAECPRLVLPARPKSRLAALRSHVGVAKRLADDCARSFGVSGAYSYEVWRLCDALWGADLENDGVAGADVQSTVNRHRQFVKWLSSAVAASTDEELARPRPTEAEDDTDKHSGRVLTLLVGGRLMEACRAARDAGDLNMAAIIAQAGGDATVRSLIARQLSLWRECGGNPFIAGSKLRTLRVLAGRVEPADLVDLDWLRAMNVHARYLCPQVPTLAKIVRSYNSSFCARVDDAGPVTDDDVDLSVVREQGYTGMRYPTPTYAPDGEMSYDATTATRRVLDLRYELIRARATDARPKLDPATYTPDPLDYSLSFLLGVWFGCLDYASPPGLAQQMEAAGLWHLAVQVLMYHPEDKARAHLVRSMLSRNAPARADTDELEARMRFLRDELHVPEQWIRLAQAHRAKYERLPAVEADHLAAAGRWNAAHEVLMGELFPITVLADDLASISDLLERMHAAAQRHHVSGWSTGGEALYQYLRVYNEIQGLVSPNETQQQQQQNSEELHARLEGIRPRLAAACRALAGVTPTNIRQAAARASLGSRLLQLSVAAGERSECIAGLLATLALPPDCSVRAQRKVTEELAAEASEGCADSSPNSPVSSRRHLVTRI